MTSGQEHPQPVAFLWFYDRPTQWAEPIEILARADFYIGRLKPYGDCVPWFTDPTISDKHLRLHAISYENGHTCEIQPLVYAEDLSTNGTYLKKRVNDHGGEQRAQLQRMQKGVAVLLEDGDELHLSPTLRFTYHLAEPEKYEVDRFTELQIAEQKFSDQYTVTNRKLGAGGYGGVYLAWDKRGKRQLACKIINRIPIVDVGVVPGAHGQFLNKEVKGQHDRKRPDAFDKQFREFKILQAVNHPNIMSLERVFWNDHTIYIFSELVTAGDLFSYLEYKGGSLSDVEAAVIIRQILKALEYLHSRNIVHRDLKAENVLMTSLADGARIVLTDFGQARYLPTEEDSMSRQKQARNRMTSLIGTADYVAPEVYNRNHTSKSTGGYCEAVDMWSVGSVTALLLSGSNIFDMEIPVNDLLSTQNARDHVHTQQDPIKRAAAKYDLSRMDYGAEWLVVGKRPKDFIRKLLVLDERQRMTVTQALEHEWFTNKHHKAEFEALYERAVKNWKPRKKVFRIAEHLGEKNIRKSRSKIRKPRLERESSADELSQDHVSPYFYQSVSASVVHPKSPSFRAKHGPPVATIAEVVEPIAEDTHDSMRTESSRSQVCIADNKALYPVKQFNVSQQRLPIEAMCSQTSPGQGNVSRVERVSDVSPFEESPLTQTELPLSVQWPLLRRIEGSATHTQDSTGDETQMTIDPAAPQCIAETPRKDSKKRHRFSSCSRIDSDIYKHLSQSTGSCLVSARAYKNYVNIAKDKKAKLAYSPQDTQSSRTLN